MPKTVFDFYKKNKEKIKNNPSYRKRMTIGSANLKPKKTPLVSPTTDKTVSKSRMVLNMEKGKAKELLEDLLEFDAKNKVLFYEVFGEKKCLNRKVKFDVIDHEKPDQRVRIGNNLKTPTTILLKHRKDNIYFFMRSTRSFTGFADYVYQFYCFELDEPLNLTIEDLEDDFVDLSEAAFIDILKERKYKKFFYPKN